MTSRLHSTQAATEFLWHALANGALSISELELKARAQGFLGEHQQIQHAKPFKKAKKALGIRSIRDGFGSDGKWAWHLPPEAIALANECTVVTPEADVDQQASPVSANTAHRPPTALEDPRTPQQAWGNGIARLDYNRAPSDVPLIRWRQFCEDCYAFLSSSENWAERAAALGWEALALFGCYRTRPLDHLGSAGLLWAINGGKLVELHRAWAVIERAEGRSRHIHHRRPVAANVTLPWTGPSRPAPR